MSGTTYSTIRTSVRVLGMLCLALLMCGIGRAAEDVATAAEDVATAAEDVATAAEDVASQPESLPLADEQALVVADETSDPLDTADEEAGSGMSRTDALIAAMTIFVLAIFVGFELITKVPPTLHTPLMSGSNAISGITVVGAILMAGSGGWAAFLGMVAVALAMINVMGGFLVTDRMLSMFQKR